jgi:hypothetical protein
MRGMSALPARLTASWTRRNRYGEVQLSDFGNRKALRRREDGDVLMRLGIEESLMRRALDPAG